MKGKLYLIPTDLGGENDDLVITPFVKQVINSIDSYIVENIRSARRYLKRIGIKTAIDDLNFEVLNKHTRAEEISTFLSPALQGKNIGLISEAGCPGIADPGAEIVAIAHQTNIEVMPLTGPSSIILALMGSGFNGQQFTFHGYLPKDTNSRYKKIRQMESEVSKTGSSHIFMDTPFRNDQLLDDVIKTCKGSTELCIASNLTCEDEFLKSKPISSWSGKKPVLNKKPTMFVLGKTQFRH